MSRQGSCVNFVRQYRPDLTVSNAPTDRKGDDKYAAFTMYKNTDFKKGKTPRIGAVLVWNKSEKVGQYGHVGIVKKIKSKNKDGTWNLVIADSNYSRDRDKKYREHEITYDPNTKTKKGKSKFLGFIYENKQIYEKKKAEAQKVVTKVYENLLHRSPDKGDKQFYTEMLLARGTIKDVKDNIIDKYPSAETSPSAPKYAQEDFKEPTKTVGKTKTTTKMTISNTPDERQKAKKITHDILRGATALTPKKAITVMQYLYSVAKEANTVKTIKDPVCRKIAIKKFGKRAIIGAGGVGVDSLVDAAIDVIVKKSDIEYPYVVRLWLKTAKNGVKAAAEGEVALLEEVIDAGSLMGESWKETDEAIMNLPSYKSLPPKLRHEVKLLYTAKEWRESNNLAKKIGGLGLELGYGFKETFLEPLLRVEEPLLMVGPVLPVLSAASPSAPKEAQEDIREIKIAPTKKKALDLSRRLALRKVDVFFLADNTGSMRGVISAVKKNAQAILDNLSGGKKRFKGVDIACGVGYYRGDPVESGESPSSAYVLQQPITANQNDIETAINAWEASGGGDAPEANFYAIHQVATSGSGIPRDGTKSTGQKTGWRTGTAKVVVVFGDEPSHQSTINEKELRNTLRKNNVAVSFIDTYSLNDGSQDTSWQALTGTQKKGAAQELADGSGGAYVPLSNTDKLVEAVNNAVYDAIAENIRTGGYLAHRTDPYRVWRCRTPGAITGKASEGGDIIDFTIHNPGYPGPSEATFRIDTTAATSVSGSDYFNKVGISYFRAADGTDIFGPTMSPDSQVYFTPEKDFFLFTLKDDDPDYTWDEAPQVHGYYGYKTPKKNLPSKRLYRYYLTDSIASPDENYIHSMEDGELFINWETGKAYGYTKMTRESPLVGIFLGTVDRDSSKIKGSYVAKAARLIADADVPRFIQDAARGNTNLQIYGENDAVGLGGTFGAEWFDEYKNPSYTSMFMAGGLKKKLDINAGISDGEVWKGFAVGEVFNRSDGSMTIATNSDPDKFKLTLQPSSGEFSGEVSVSDGTEIYNLATSRSDSVYLDPAFFAAVKEVNSAPAYIASDPDSSEYNYLSWGKWSVDTGGSPEKTVFCDSPWLAGRLTPYRQIPTKGSATYTGKTRGWLRESGDYYTVEGVSSLNANFAERTLKGKFKNMEKDDGSAWTDIQVNAGWGSKNKITGTTAASGMSGEVNGAFYGPNAQEVGGSWTLKGSGAKAGGVFTGKR